MSNEKIVPFPERPGIAARRRAEQLSELFRAAGRGQPDVFANLSREVERLVAETKSRKGEKSGAMQRAFGENHVRMKGRFCAKGGVAPDKICKTPQTWLEILAGFADVLERDRSLTISNALEEAMADRRPASRFGQDAWLADFEELLESMSARLASVADLPAISDDIARSGLYLDGDKLGASEWPAETGIEPGGLYNPGILGLIPHVLGLNYEPIADADFHLEEATSDAPVWEMLASNGVQTDALVDVSFVNAIEGIRTGLAFAVRADTGLPELAILEWHVASIRLLDENGLLLRELPAGSKYPLPTTFNASPGACWEPEEGEQRNRPQYWEPNSLRFHFREPSAFGGTSAFERMAASLIVRPWVYGDPDEHGPLFGPEPHLVEDYPLSCPRHTVAGAVEGNLQYSDELGRPEERIDRQLVGQIHRILGLVTDFRRAGDARLQAARTALLSEWRANAPENSERMDNGK